VLSESQKEFFRLIRTGLQIDKKQGDLHKRLKDLEWANLGASEQTRKSESKDTEIKSLDETEAKTKSTPFHELSDENFETFLNDTKQQKELINNFLNMVKEKIPNYNYNYKEAEPYFIALSILETKASELTTKARTNKNYQQASNVANQLSEDLHELGKDYFFSDKKMSAESFKQKGLALVTNEHTVKILSTHRGWKGLLNDIALFLNAVVKIVTGYARFFSPPPTDSEKTLDILKDELKLNPSKPQKR